MMRSRREVKITFSWDYDEDPTAGQDLVRSLETQIDDIARVFDAFSLVRNIEVQGDLGPFDDLRWSNLLTAASWPDRAADRVDLEQRVEQAQAKLDQWIKDHP